MAHPRNQDGLTPHEARFVKNLALGMTQTQAARAAGYKFPSEEGHACMKRPRVQEALARERARYEEKADITRQKVMDGLKESIEMARLVSDPNAMVSGWREIAKICGYYAPETKRVEISARGAEAALQLQSMTDEELVRLIIEGDFSKVVDIDEPGLEVPRLTVGTTFNADHSDDPEA